MAVECWLSLAVLVKTHEQAEVYSLSLWQLPGPGLLSSRSEWAIGPWSSLNESDGNFFWEKTLDAVWFILFIYSFLTKL
jgi:hypothetical protein